MSDENLKEKSAESQDRDDHVKSAQEQIKAAQIVANKQLLEADNKEVNPLPADSVKEAISGEDETLNWQVDADSALIYQEPLRARSILYVLGITIVLIVIWASFAKLDVVTRGEGKVIPTRQVQVIQSFDGGVVTGLEVQEGDIVEVDQLLVRLDATRFRSTLRENKVDYMVSRVKAARLKSISEDIPFEPKAEWLEKIPDVVAQQKTLYKSSLEQLDSLKKVAEYKLEQRLQELAEIKASQKQFSRAFELSARELEKTKPLVSSGAVSEVELLRLERDVIHFLGERDRATAQKKGTEAAIAEARGRSREVELEYKKIVREELADVTKSIKGLYESSIGLTDRVTQTSVRSPVHGTVKRLFFNTIGGVVLPGKEVIEIIPLDEALLLEARINPKNIAFLTLGQKAIVKFTAYDFSIYGGLEASVVHIGADTVTDNDGNPFYTVRVRTLESSLGKDKPIIPGMVAQVDILTGKKSVLSYLLKPILRAKQYALTER